MAKTEFNAGDNKMFAAGYNQAIIDLKLWQDTARNNLEEGSDAMQTAQALILYLEGTAELRKDLKIKVSLPEQNDR